MTRLPRIALLLLLFATAASPRAPAAAAASEAVPWRTQWTQSLFEEAARTHRFVLLDLHAVWCHWCHVIDEQTYADPAVQKLITAHYLAVSVDADSDPALSSRYGDWGWPATIVLAADGTEIVKRRGFIAPEQMASLLQAIVDDPSPGPSVQKATPPAAGSGLISAAERAAFTKTYEQAYDAAYGGWGSGQKFLDDSTIEYTLRLVTVERDATAERHLRRTLEANLQLIDPVWGGVFQYSATPDWRSPHYEKLLSFQADDLRLYSEAYARWHDPRYLKAAQALRDYVMRFLRSPDGAFYVSQDADLSPTVSGEKYYSRDDTARRQLGIPRVDTHIYARENGWEIRALARAYDVTGDQGALSAAVRAADWVLSERAVPHGGFRHGGGGDRGPYLADTLSMGQAFLALYRSSGERRWVTLAQTSMNYIESEFRDPRGGYFTVAAPAGAVGVFADPTRTVDENVAVARFANLLFHYTVRARDRLTAQHALKFLAGAASTAGPDQLHADILLADRELATSPVHITVVGAKADPRARALHAAALRFPATYLQVDWWDKSEGALPDTQIQYPTLARAAAFACTQNTCSNPVFEPGDLFRTVTAALDTR